MPGEKRHRASIAEITIQSEEFKDKGVCIVVRKRPFTALVPSHTITALEDGVANRITIHGVEMSGAEIVAASNLEKAHLSLVRFKGRAPRGLRAMPLPRRITTMIPGQPSELQLPKARRSGQITEIKLLGDQATLITDIPAEPGDSGSPLFVEGKLAGACMGRTLTQDDGGQGNALAVPLSEASIRELRAVRYHVARTVTAVSLSAIMIAVAALAIRSWTTFSLAGIEAPDNVVTGTLSEASTITATNGQLVTFRTSWTRTFDTPIRWWIPLSSRIGSPMDYIAVGTRFVGHTPGSLYLLDSMGREVWNYTVPNDECPYDGKDEFNDYGSYNGYYIYRIGAADLTGDGQSEVVAVFIHDDYYPCKIMVFQLNGDILGEYWHPGYLRTFSAGPVGSAHEPMLILTGSNNRFRGDSPYNPQGLLAFCGADLSGQAPPYTGDGPKGNEAWYFLIQNMDSDHRAMFHEIMIQDCDGDGVNEIAAKTDDGRLYYLDREGKVLLADRGDEFLKEFGYAEVPELVWVELGLDSYEPIPIPWEPAHAP